MTVIVCTYNRARSLRATLNSLQQLHVPRPITWELLVVDNNSTDNTRAVVTEYQSTVSFPVRYVFERRQGTSHARNRGIVEARGDILAFTDDDVIVAPQWLAALQATYDQWNCLGVGGRVVPVWNCSKPAWLAETGPYRLMKVIVAFGEGEESCVLNTPPFGANMSFKKAAFEKYGLFRTDLGRKGTSLIGGEDTEFGRRLLHHHERLVYSPDAVLFHPVAAERATKRYFERWYFAYGRAEMRVQAPSTQGLQRVLEHAAALLHSVCASAVRWACTVDAQRRFYSKLATYQELGRLREAYRLLRNGHGATAPRITATD